MRQPIAGKSKTKMPPNKVIRPNGDVYTLYSVSEDKGGLVAEYKAFEFPKSAGKKALEKKQQTKMKKATSSMKAKKKK